MGTSSSSKGAHGRSPLVPPWADKDGLGPGPTPDPSRFKGFRTQLGKFVANGGTDDHYLKSAVGRYARTATGGRNVGPRRFGSMVETGESLFSAFADLRQGVDPPNLTLSDLQGKDIDVVIDILVQALVPEDGDADRTRAALNEALSECLEGQTTFDVTLITDELMVELMLAYVRNCVFGIIVQDSNESFSKGDPRAVERAERELRSLIDVAVDKHMRPLLVVRGGAIAGTDVATAQRAALREIWAEWEAYEE